MALLDQLAQEQALAGLLAQRQQGGIPQFHQVGDVVPQVSMQSIIPQGGFPAMAPAQPPQPPTARMALPAGSPEPSGPPPLAGGHVGPGGTLKPLPAAATQPQQAQALGAQPGPFAQQLQQTLRSPLFGAQLGFGGASF